MSQRLLITLKKNVTEEDDYFDYIYTEEGTFEGLMIEWCAYDPEHGFYSGPWKISIRGREVFDQFMGDFVKLKKYIPKLQSLKDCWAVWEGDKVYRNKEIDAEMGKALEAICKVVEKEDQS